MSHLDKDLYTASCNPPRRAKKRLRLDTDKPSTSPQTRDGGATASPPAVTLQPRPLLPKLATSPRKSVGSDVSSTSPIAEPTSSNASSTLSASITTNPQGKRGRKPGPLSRSAREAQRRLNHSIIEKARRTKINNALATLKELVPPGYDTKAKAKENNVNDEDDSDDDGNNGDGEYVAEGKKTKRRSTGKKEEKEREYKLEILVRTVTFMQDLLERVNILEQANLVCSNCGSSLDTTLIQSEGTGFGQSGPSSDPKIIRGEKRPRVTNYDREPSEPIQAISPSSPFRESAQETTLTRHRLPSISSWLPETLLDPSIFKASSRRGHAYNSQDSILPLQLPTPPSTRFNPPATSTSPMSTSRTEGGKQVLSPLHTPEDEHAATMLLQISNGAVDSPPTFRPLPPSIIPLSGPTPSTPPPLPRSIVYVQGQPEGIGVQTPASLLGLITPPNS